MLSCRNTAPTEKKCGSGPSGCDGPGACSPTGRMVSCVFIISPHDELFQGNRLLANFWRSLTGGELPGKRSNISLSIRSGACVPRSLNWLSLDSCSGTTPRNGSGTVGSQTNGPLGCPKAAFIFARRMQFTWIAAIGAPIG